MLFNSVSFLLFFPFVILFYFVLPKFAKNTFLLIASYIFYMCWNPIYGFLLFGCTFVTWIFALLIQYRKLYKTSLFIGLVVIFSALAYYKYTNFLIDQLNNILALFNSATSFEHFDIVLPVGISFFTFQAAGYLIDVYKKETTAEKNFFRYALFVSFFPQLVAGPIERSKHLLGQLSKTYSFDDKRVIHGLCIMLWGLFLKMAIADRCALIADHVFANYATLSGIQLVVGMLAFSLQIYCDFCGYSTIARGAAKVIGIDLIDNFRQPYFSQSIKEFWRRWHISLSYWLRDYLYIPLGGSRGSKLKTYRNLLITFLISGLWHGSNWNFIVWGAVHGLYIVIMDVLTPTYNSVLGKLKISKETLSYSIFTRIVTFILVAHAWIFFRTPDLTVAGKYIANMYKLNNLGIVFNGGLLSLGIDLRNLTILIVSAVVLFIFSLVREMKGNITSFLEKEPYAVKVLLVWVILSLVILSCNLSTKEFIYFQF